MSYPIEKLAFDCRSKVVQIVSQHNSIQFLPSVGIIINKGYIVTHACSCYVNSIRPEQIYAIVEINNEKCIIPTKLIGIDPHYNLAVLHIGKYETPFFQWKKGKSRNMKPGEIVFTIGYQPTQSQSQDNYDQIQSQSQSQDNYDQIQSQSQIRDNQSQSQIQSQIRDNQSQIQDEQSSLVSDIQAGILCTNNYTGANNPGECIVTSGITKCSLGSPLINDNGHVVGIYMGNGIWLSEYSMRAVIRSLCKFEFSPIQTTSGKYTLYPRKFIGCTAQLYKGEYFFTTPNYNTSLIAGYKVNESFVDNIIPGDVMTHIVVDQKQYTLGCGRRQISASTVIEKSTDKITVKGFRLSPVPTEEIVFWEIEVTPTECRPIYGLI